MRKISLKEIQQNLSLEIKDAVLLNSCLVQAFDFNDLHLATSIILYKIPRQNCIENGVVASLCISDAFLRTNNKKISLIQIQDPGTKRSQDLAKTVSVLDQIRSGKMSINEIKNWLLWHIIDANKADKPWVFLKEQKDLIGLLDRQCPSSSTTNSTKKTMKKNASEN